MNDFAQWLNPGCIETSSPCICKLTHSSVRALYSEHSFTRVYWAAGSKTLTHPFASGFQTLLELLNGFMISCHDSLTGIARPGPADPHDPLAGDGQQNQVRPAPEWETLFAPNACSLSGNLNPSILSQVHSHVKWLDKTRRSPTSFLPQVPHV